VFVESDLVLAVSRPLGAYARRRGASRVEVMANAVDPTRFTRQADAAGEPPVAVFAGSLRRWHGVGTLAEAWSILAADAPRLVVVGDGDGRDRLASVGAQVTGWVAPDAVAPLLGRAQIGLAPYPADAPRYFSPLKLFDYLAAGLAVVAADLPGVRDVAADAALLVPPGDPAALADAVQALVADPELRRHLGADGRALALEHHTWDQRARRLVALVDELRTVAAR
jgi:glycosyltransferase involved in cell wall biosynthesis